MNLTGKKVAVAVVFGCLVLLAVYFVIPRKSVVAEISLQANRAGVVRHGGAIYRQYCASCHGTNLKGEPDWQTPNADMTMPAPPHDETGHTWHHSDQVLFELTKYGLATYLDNPTYKSNMPAYENVLTDREIIAVLSYIKSIWFDEIRKRHDELNAR